MKAVPTTEPAMPLLDHFHPPLSRTHPWRAFHGAWASAMALYRTSKKLAVRASVPVDSTRTIA